MSKNPKRTTVPEEIKGFYPEDCTAVGLRKELDELIAEYGDSVYIDRRYEIYDDGVYFSFYYRRPETDEEYNKRCFEADLDQRYREQIERKELERLKAKYNE